MDACPADELTDTLSGVEDWGALVRAAEAHGLAPLVYTQVAARRVVVPRGALRSLQGLFVRHREASAVRSRALLQILTAFDDSGIECLVLKGAALAHLVYPEAALRPMGDLDLLVRQDQLPMAQIALAKIGFATLSPNDSERQDKHLIAVGSPEGLTIKVELHRSLFPPGSSDTISTEELFTSRRQQFHVAGRAAFTLDNDAMLWHLCRHLVFHADVFTRLRLIWIADIISVAEKFAGSIDWEHLRTDRPIVLDVLSLLDLVVPLSDEVRRLARLPYLKCSRESWADFGGWPRQSLGDLRAAGKSVADIVCDTFIPPPWWLRLHHGLGISRPLWLHRCAKHPLEIAYWIGHHLWHHSIPHLAGG
jgi:hypothetical protein